MRKRIRRWTSLIGITALAVFVISSIFGGISYAGPAIPDIQTLQQSNGATFEAKQWGDEWLNGWETKTGYAVALDENTKNWTYAVTDPDGRLVPSPMVVGVAPVPVGFPQNMRPSGVALQAAVQQAAAAYAPPMGSQPVTKGTANIPVILINFNDRTTTYTPQDFQNLLFGKGNKSMKDYYEEVSYGAFTVSSGSAGVVGWYTASHAHNYYGYNQGFPKARELVMEAIQFADTKVNFADYDTDGDCYVDIMVIHQGNGTEAGGDTTNIWSHKWYVDYLTNDTAACGRIKIRNYSIQPETLYGGMTTVGVFAHEFGHVLGLPDLYDTDGSSQGVGNWDIMAGGSWNGVSRAGDTPAHLSAWSKIALKWVTPIQVTGMLPNESIEAVSNQPDVYQFLPGSPDSSGEYFLIENRNKAKFDLGLPGSGLAIWHIDESQKRTDNTDNANECYLPNNCSSKHYRVALVQADNLWNLEKNNNRGDTGDLFPGATGKTVFDDNSSPSTKLYNGTASQIVVKNISAAGATMTATLCYGAQGNITVTPTSLNFGDVNVGSSKDLPLTISNNGCADTSLGAFSDVAPFKVKSTTCSGTLVSGGICTVTLTFTPTVSGAVSKIFSVTSGTNNHSIPLSGNGINSFMLTVLKNGTGTGTITSNPAGINCGSDCTESYQASTMVTLTATPNSGSIFSGWSGACTGTAVCNVTMDAAKTVTATFSPAIYYTLKVLVLGVGHGIINTSPSGINNCSVAAPTGQCSAPYPAGTEVTVSGKILDVADSLAYEISWWIVDNGTYISGSKVTMNSSKTVVAIFGGWQRYLLEEPCMYTKDADFGQIKFGAVYPSLSYKSVSVRNMSGSFPLIVSSSKITGTNADEFFKYSSSCTNKFLLPGESCVEYIRHTPKSVGIKNAILEVSSDAFEFCGKRNGFLRSEVIEPAITEDVACNLTPTIKTNGWFKGPWAVYDRNTGDYTATPIGIWDQDRVPNENDVVLITDNATVIGIPSTSLKGMKVKALCNKGRLETMQDQSMEIKASEGITNYGTITGNIVAQQSVKDNGNCDQKLGNSVTLKAGTSFSQTGKLGDWWHYGNGKPIVNKGIIEGGNGGNSDTIHPNCAGNGGDAIVLGRNTINDISGIIKAGKGGNSNLGNGGKGGLTQVWGKLGGAGDLINKGSITAGNGGDGCGAGSGGNLWLVSLPNVYLMQGSIHKSGSIGITASKCMQGKDVKDGFIQIEPSLISIGTGTQVEGGDITIFGGNDWTLDLSNASGTLVKSKGDITLQVGEGSVVNLTGNTAPVLEATGKVTILSDNILTDDGVKLSDIIKANEIVTGPAKILYAVSLTGPGKVVAAPNAILPLRLTLANSGPVKDTYNLIVTDKTGWQISAIEPSLEIEGIDAVDVALNVTVPSVIGKTNVITVTATSQSDPTVSSSTEIYLEVAEPKVDPPTPPSITYNLSGYVRDKAANPIAGVALEAGSKTGMTDDKGYYTITGIAEGEYIVNARKDGYVINPAKFLVGKGQDATADLLAIKIEGNYKASGIIQDLSGKPIAGVTVNIGDRTAITNTTGYWEIAGFGEGSYAATASKDGYQFTSEQFTITNGQNATVSIKVTSEPTLKAGIFTVNDTGIVKIDWLYDGGAYRGEMGIFNIAGMENLTPGSPEFIAEAVKRVLSNSDQGYVVLSDPEEGARFSGLLGGESKDWNAGPYKGLKSFAMTPGTQFATILVPNSTFAELAKNPATTDTNTRPLFSIVSQNPAYGTHIGQMADINGMGKAFAFEDKDAATSDWDFNDLIIQIIGAESSLPTLDSLVGKDAARSKRQKRDNSFTDWRVISDLGKLIMAHIETPTTGAVQITLDGNADLTVYDAQGRLIGKEGGYIPGSTLELINGSQIVSLPDIADYRLMLKSFTNETCTMTVSGDGIATQQKQFDIAAHKLLKADVSGGTVSDPAVPKNANGKILLSDFNGDGVIDEKDIAKVKKLWNCKTGDACYDPFYDFDGDGQITVSDIMQVSYQYQSPAPVGVSAD